MTLVAQLTKEFTMAEPAVFISYASEDALVANALEKALLSLSKELSYGLVTILDVHSFNIGRPTRKQIIERLRQSEILFIVYTAALKKSHSWTGFEVGAFSAMMEDDIEQKKSTSRRIFSLYLDEMPATEGDVLGIKLNVQGLGRTERAGDKKRKVTVKLDEQKNLYKALCDISDTVTERMYDKLDRAKVERLKEDRHVIIEKKIMNELEKSLKRSLSAVIASKAIEQLMLEFHWREPIDFSNNEFLAGASLRAEATSSYELFGIGQEQKVITWPVFEETLFQNHIKYAPFIVSAVRDAIKSGLTAGPVDNDQILISPSNKMYRIIVTRHFTFFDGSRTMNVYFIPFLSRFPEVPPAGTLALLNVAVRFRMAFIVKEAALAVRVFDLWKGDRVKFYELIKSFMHTILIIEDESHIHKLDDPVYIATLLDGSLPDREIVSLFAEWKSYRDAIVDHARKIESMSVESQEFQENITPWIDGLKKFIVATTPINKKIGLIAANKIKGWFDGSKPVQGMAKRSKSPSAGISRE